MPDFSFIANGIRPVELPNPMANMLMASKIQEAQQTQQMNALAMQEKQRAYEEQNAMHSDPRFKRGINENNVDALLMYGPTGRAIHGEWTKGQEHLRKAGESQEKIATERMSFWRNLLPAATPENWPSMAARIRADLPGIAQLIPDQLTEQAREGLITKADDWLKKREPKIVSADASVYVPGQGTAYTAPSAPTTEMKNFSANKLPEFAGLEDTILKGKRAGAPKTSITVSTEKKYGEALAAGLAPEDLSLRATAMKAPAQAESANRVLTLLDNPGTITGTAADVRLQIAKAMNLVGANDNETAANTEALVSAMGKATLDAIKSSGLGTGQGFTDKDREFLQGIAGGKITMEPQQIRRLAVLAHRTAEQSTKAWDARRSTIPASALSGTGLTAESFTVPPMVGSKGTKTVVNTGTDRAGRRVVQYSDGSVDYAP